MHVAACEGHIELVKFLLNVGHVQPEPHDRLKNIWTLGGGTIVGESGKKGGEEKSETEKDGRKIQWRDGGARGREANKHLYLKK